MDDKETGGTRSGELIPTDPLLKPHLTIRSKTSGCLIYDIDPDQLPTETITRGGRRIFIDEAGALRESLPAGRSNYEVLDKISEGGMGLVYNVKDNSLKREVALKICRTEIKPDAQMPKELEEFTNEAYMTAHLDHPGVVPIYALAKDADGRPFFAMKKVAGTSWNDLLHPDAVKEAGPRAAIETRARQMTWKDHFEILLKVCDAVAYAHSKSILHRDLKPENIMLGDYGEVYVMDWGLAMYFDERNEYKRFPDLKPQLAGTPNYMAPEMVRGEMKSLCPASDIYLLGGILYEIITGKPPHDGPSVMEMLRMVARNSSIPPPETVSGSPLITPALSRIVMKALAPKLGARYQTVTEFQQALREYIANSESMAVCGRARETLETIRRDLPDSGTMDKESAAVVYGKLSECIGGFQQAVELWAGNMDARRGLLEALTTQIRLAVQQNDLMLARAQFRMLDRVKNNCTDNDLIKTIEARDKDLAAQIESRQALLDSAARQVRWWKAAAAALAIMVLGGLAAIVTMTIRQKALAVQNEKNMFGASVTGRAQMMEQFMRGIEQIAVLYGRTAAELMSCPADRLPFREPTPAGRDGFYFDEDFYDAAAQPPGMVFSDRYNATLSMDFPTVVRSPWARDVEHEAAVNDAAARLGRMNSLFSHVHQTRDDIQWSLAGSAAGLLVGFPGFGRYRDKPDYDATRRAWYKAAIHAKDDNPVWGNPYADASTRKILMSCMCRINANRRNVGVVGLEVTLETLQKMLLDFSQSMGGRRRGLLIRPFEETDAATGQTNVVHRIVVDTRYRRSSEDWQANLEMVPVKDAGEDIHSFYKNILAGKYAPGLCYDSDGSWMAFAPLKDHKWILIAILEHGEK